MDKTDIISNNKEGIGNLAVDGLIYGLVGGVAMYLFMAAVSIISRDGLGNLLGRFSVGGLTTPLQGLLGHLAVSAIYGLLFGVLIWPVLRRISTRPISGWIGGLVYAGCLFLLAQLTILPMTDSPLGEIPAWHFALGHAVYGLVLGGMFSRKAT